MGATITAGLTLELVTCSACGLTFAMPEAHVDRLRASHATFYCPSGHRQYFPGKSDEEKLREQLQRERDSSARKTAQLDQTNALLNGQRARAARFKNDRDRERERVANGVCPCCNRTFANLAAHMAGEHPGFGKEDDDA